MSAPFNDDLDVEDDFDDGVEDASSRKFPKMEELCGRLLLIKISKIEEVPKTDMNGNPVDGMEKKVTANVTVLTGDEIQEQSVPVEYDNMWITNQPLIESIEGAYNRGNMSSGTLRRGPGKKIMHLYPTPDHVEEALRNREIKEFQTCWKLFPRTDEDKKIVREYLKSRKRNVFS